MNYLGVIGKKSQEFIIAFNNAVILILNSNYSGKILIKCLNQFK